MMALYIGRDRSIFWIPQKKKLYNLSYLKIPTFVAHKSCYLESEGHCFDRLDKGKSVRGNVMW
jgi:hypothetical protein